VVVSCLPRRHIKSAAEQLLRKFLKMIAAVLRPASSHSDVRICRMASTALIQPQVQPDSMDQAPQPWSALLAQYSHRR
jgi:hypothetical protein